MSTGLIIILHEKEKEINKNSCGLYLKRKENLKNGGKLKKQNLQKDITK